MNPILEAAEQKVESQLLPSVKADYDKIVVAGMRAAIHGGANGLTARLKNAPDPIAACAAGAVNLVMLMSHQSKGLMPTKAMIPAAATLMFHALDLIDSAGIAKVGADELGRATHVFANRIFAAFKITLPMLNNAAAHVHGVIQDPTKMELINRKAGVVKVPGASTPTTLPPESALVNGGSA